MQRSCVVDLSQLLFIDGWVSPAFLVVRVGIVWDKCAIRSPSLVWQLCKGPAKKTIGLDMGRHKGIAQVFSHAHITCLAF